MNKLIAILILVAGLASGVSLANDDPVDCFYDHNSKLPECRK